MSQRLGSSRDPLPELVLSFGLGENHTANEVRMPDGYARRMSNFDIDNEGVVTTRPQLSVVPTMPGGHSMYTSLNGDTFYASGSSLLRVIGSATAPVLDWLGQPVVLSGGSRRLWWADVNGETYFSNGVSTGRIKADGYVWPWGVPNAVHQVADASAPQTVYVTWVNPAGEESGAVQCDTGYATLVQPGYTKRLYWADADSELFRLDGIGRQCDTIGLIPMPAGTMLTWHAGRLWVAVGNMVYYSQSLRYGLCDPGYNYIEVPGEITALGAVTGGLYVCTADTVWFYDGTDPDKMTSYMTSNLGAIYGTQFNASIETINPEMFGAAGTQLGIGDVFGWLSTQGLVIAMPGGIVRDLRSDNVRIPDAAEGVTSLIVRDGYSQFVTVVSSNATAGRGAAIDYSVSNP